MAGTFREIQAVLHELGSLTLGEYLELIAEVERSKEK